MQHIAEAGSGRAAPLWSSGAFEAGERQDAWTALLRDVYGGWTLRGRLDAGFQAWCRHRGDPVFGAAECVCDPCAADRPLRTCGNGPELFSIQLVLAGREHVAAGDEALSLAPGDVLLWDTARAMRFHAPERLHKLSVMLPLPRLHSWLPGAHRLLPRRLPAGSTGARLLSAYLGSVSPAYMAGELCSPEGLSEAGIGLVASLLGQPHPRGAAAVRELQLRRIQAYIDAHLCDPALSPPRIAQANRISLRYLHELFDAAGATVMQYLIGRRLARGHRELGNPRMARRKIGDIALSCGFSSLTHFARRFRAHYGLSPQEYRLHCQAAAREQAPALPGAAPAPGLGPPRLG